MHILNIIELNKIKCELKLLVLLTIRRYIFCIQIIVFGIHRWKLADISLSNTKHDKQEVPFKIL